jgi:cytochrome b
MQRSSRAWILLPAAVVVIAVIGVVVSNYQKEVGLAEPSKGGTAAVAAAIAARDLSKGTGADAYRGFGEALLVAMVARNNAALINTADARLDNLLAEALDCLTALREAWQAELEGTWNPETHGEATYWSAMHPAVTITAGAGDGPLTAGEVRDFCREKAAEILKEAGDLVS